MPRPIPRPTAPSAPRVGTHPVTIDPSGRIFYADTGERVVVPGLEPEKVLQGLADDEAGRLTPLDDFIAELEAEAGPDA